MKIITKPFQHEEYRYECDICKKEAVSFLVLTGEYGSDFDLMEYKLDLCRECGNKFLDKLKIDYPVLQEREIDL